MYLQVYLEMHKYSPDDGTKQTEICFKKTVGAVQKDGRRTILLQ